MSTVELTHTVAMLERTLAADEALAEAMELDPRLHARAGKLRRRAHRLLRELGAALASSPTPVRPERLSLAIPQQQLQQLTAQLESFERRMAAMTYDVSLRDLGAAG